MNKYKILIVLDRKEIQRVYATVDDDTVVDVTIVDIAPDQNQTWEQTKKNILRVAADVFNMKMAPVYLNPEIEPHDDMLADAHWLITSLEHADELLDDYDE